MGPKRDPNLMQLGQMAIEPVLLVISIMASVVAQAVTLLTAALAIEAGRTKAMDFSASLAKCLFK